MKTENRQEFEKVIAEKPPTCILLLVKDPYEQKELLTKAISTFENRFSKEGVFIKKLKEDIAKTLKEELYSTSLFGKKEEILVLEAVDDLKAGELESIVQALPPPSHYYILCTATSLTASTPLYKAFLKHGLILSLPEEKPWVKVEKLADWIVGFCKKEGVHIGKDVALLLSKEYSHDRFLLEKELEKLLIYAAFKKNIEFVDVHALSTVMPKAILWQLYEPLMKKELSKALTLLDELIENDLHPLQIVRYLRGQLSTSLKLSSLLDQNLAPDAIQEHFPQMKGTTFSKNLEIAKRGGSSFFQKALLKIDALEVDLKNTAKDGKLCLETFMVSLK